MFLLFVLRVCVPVVGAHSHIILIGTDSLASVHRTKLSQMVSQLNTQVLLLGCLKYSILLFGLSSNSFPHRCCVILVFIHTSRRVTDPCQVNPCQNGGVCRLIPLRDSFECSCPESFTGRLCEQSKWKCYYYYSINTNHNTTALFV